MNSYDAFAWLYDRYWGEPLQVWEMPALERLVLNSLPPGAHILDLCCGTGHLARELVNRGWLVTGVDNSSGMLEIAKRNIPENAEFLLQSVTEMHLPGEYAAAVCTFDSINHILDPAALQASFSHIAQSLCPGAPFVFDVNTPEAYGERWNTSATVIEPDHVFFLRGNFDAEAARGHTQITIFREQNGWFRTDISFQQRPWTIEQLTPLLQQAGFRTIESWHAQRDLQMEGSYGIGRLYVRAFAA